MTTSAPKLTIVIPTYNRLEFLKEAINSCILSASMAENSTEVLVGNNCSTDGTKRYLEKLSSKPFQNIEFVAFNHHSHSTNAKLGLFGSKSQRGIHSDFK